MRALLRGLVAGTLLSCLRAPPGIDFFQTSAVAGHLAYGWRAAAIAAVALGLFAAQQGAITARLLIGACLGFAIHGLLFANHWAPSSTTGLVLTAIAGLAAIACLRASDEESQGDSAPPKLFEMIGLALAGAGAALSIEAIARHVRLFQGGLLRDDSVSGSVVLAILAIGALAFGWAATHPGFRGVGTPVLVALAAATCAFSERVAIRLADPQGLTVWLRRLGLQPTANGTLGYDVVIAAALLAVPILLLGAVLPAPRGRNRLFALLVGAAVGLAFLPALLELAPGSTAKDPQPSISEIVPLGSIVASAGALLAILSISDRSALARWSGIATSAAATLPAILVKVDPLHVLSPWFPHPVFPLYLTDAPEGLVTVESFGILGGAWAFATVDRHRVTPEIEGARADALRLRASFELVPAERRAKGKLRVLLVGQLSPERARILADGGAGRIDRTAGWASCMANVEDALYGALPEERAKPEGDVLAIPEAGSRMRNGDYDLVIAAPTPGDVPDFRPSGAPASTVVVRWIDLDQPAAHQELGERVALIVDGLDRPALATVENASSVGDGRYAPLLLRAGSPAAVPTPIALLSQSGNARIARAGIAARLAEAERGGPLEDVTAGFAAYFAAALADEDPMNGVQIPEACLERFEKAALAGPPDPTLQRTFETLARVLAGQRAVAKIDTYLRPVAEKYSPWDALEKALARVDLEAKRPDEAMRRLDPIRESHPDDFELWSMLGEAHCAGGDPTGALECWRHAISIAGIDRATRREVAMILAGCSDADARSAAAHFLSEFPDDKELRTKLDADAASLPRAPCPEGDDAGIGPVPR